MGMIVEFGANKASVFQIDKIKKMKLNKIRSKNILIENDSI